MQPYFDDESLTVAQSSLEAGRYVCAVGAAWSAVTYSLGQVRNCLLENRDPQWRSLGWTNDAKQSMIYVLLSKMAGAKPLDNIVFEIERLYQQEIDANHSPKPVSREEAVEAIDRARLIEKEIRALLRQSV